MVLAVLALGSGAAFAWVKLRVPTHKVPTLVGLTEQQAREQAQANHWKVRKLDGRQDGSVIGNVIGQDPTAGKSLAEDKTVTITVSLGNTLVAVPADLVGKTVPTPTAELQAISLDLGDADAAARRDRPGRDDHRRRSGDARAAAEGREGQRDRLRRPGAADGAAAVARR